MIVFVPPLLQLLVFAFAATLEVRNIDIAVHNQDAGRWSHELVTRLDRADFITQVHRVTDSQELRRLIDQGKVIAALDIQPDFSRAIASGDTGPVQLLVDGRRSHSGQTTPSYHTAPAPAGGREATAATTP